MATTFTQHVLAAWTRWCQRQRQGAASATAASSAELEAQFALLASGLVATLSDDALALVCSAAPDDAASLWSQLLPLDERLQQDADRVQFLLVVVSELLRDRPLASSNAQWVVESLALPTLVTRSRQRMHAIAIQLVTQLAGVDAVRSVLRERIVAELLPTQDSANGDGDDDVAYIALCRALQLVVDARAPADAETLRAICRRAIERFDSQPRFLRAVSLYLLPTLVDTEPLAVAELVETAVTTWQTSASVARAIAASAAFGRSVGRPPQGGYPGSQVANLLYVLCLLLPRDPTLIRSDGLQALIAFALTHADPLLRKQALHLLKVAFSHYAALRGERVGPLGAEDADADADAAAEDTAKGKRRKTKKPKKPAAREPAVSPPVCVDDELEAWQQFLLASDVIQLHHEPHLLEQVWPQVAALLESRLLRAPAAASSNWPVAFSFPWMQSLLMRVFRHENPVVRRTFLSNFMELAATQLERASDADADADANALAFVWHPEFERFVLHRLLRVCNDPLMYKSSRRVPFQRLITRFLAAFLSFRLRARARAPADAPWLLDTFLNAACDAVFGPGTETAHSPEAIISMLQVFEEPTLQHAIQRQQQQQEQELFSLSAAALDKTRFILDVYVLRSFPQSMRTQTVRALLAALTTDGFTRASALPLPLLARLVHVLPARQLSTSARCDGLRQLHAWLARADGDELRRRVAAAVLAYLGGDATTVPPAALARLLVLLRADGTDVGLAVQRPIEELVSLAPSSSSSDDQLLELLGHVETELEQLSAGRFSGVGLAPAATAASALVFRPTAFYGEHNTNALVTRALQRCESWLAAAVASTDAGADDDDDSGEPEDDATAERERERLQLERRVVSSSATLVTQLATFAMEERGDLALLQRLDAFCQRVVQFLSATRTRRHEAHEAIALQLLALVAAQPLALDAMDAFHAAALLPVVLSAAESSSGASPRGAWSADVRFARVSSQWRLVHLVLRASVFVPTELLREALSQSVATLSSTGASASLLLDVTYVLSLALGRLGTTLLAAPPAVLETETETDAETDAEAQLDALFCELWAAYDLTKPKPDALTRALVHCMFQPAFLRREELCAGPTALMRRWFRRLFDFGHVHRPNVLFHVACRLAQCWRGAPETARWFVDEIVELLLFKEPRIADKQRSPGVPDVLRVSGDDGDDNEPDDPAADDDRQGRAAASTAVSTAETFSVRDRFVRFIILSFLDELAVDDGVAADETAAATDADADAASAVAARELVDGVLLRLLDMNFADDWQRHFMLNSDGFGKKLRCWQALSVLSRHVQQRNLAAFSQRFWRAFTSTQLPNVRFYMEVLGMQLARRFAARTLPTHLLPLLRDFSLTPQVGASLLLVVGVVVHERLADDRDRDGDRQWTDELLVALFPWLNASHGHTRVMAQFLLGMLLPRYLHRVDARGGGASSVVDAATLASFREIARFLSENKECKRMFRRQAKQFESFSPATQCTMLGLLSSSYLNDVQELFPREDAISLSAQLKDMMTVLYEQFQREHFADELAGKRHDNDRATAAAADADGDSETETGKPINVQRKIDTSAVLLDDSVLPVAMKESRDELPSLNSLQRRRQPVILCASLVDKVPNLAGLARTCEIFNASRLVVPSLRVCDDEAFETISVTANKWIPMEEVRPEHLVAALQSWKAEGFTIVAVEQTASSRCLSQFAFPEKIVIVLGKEKEGIPVDVLQMVDVCVEIPQFGLIRSLNVHVSGAILLWEYTQQRLNQQLLVE
ncbi:hypothetical protein P43SY_010554 [Pythium insidiosum]|uniref:tRNA (guanosine(18)-2'-O)-methyltransferase TARBP1 n=1 Tax=Pythium insidiosum TaxID=114742 RepID=A0AAD5M0C2_PYTIN|nr:hypothetical protein P43SY_010554 [Pythium insidiosum]